MMFLGKAKHAFAPAIVILTALAGAAVGLASAPASAPSSTQPNPGTRPDTRPAATMPKADYSTPQRAAVTYFNAWQFGDWPAVRDGFVAYVSVMRRAEANMGALAAERDLEGAALERFGPHRDRISDSFPPAAIYRGMSEAFSADDVKVVQEGSSATVSTAMKVVFEKSDAGRGMETDLVVIQLEFIKVGESWKYLGTRESFAGSEARWGWQKATFGQIARDIRSGKLKTFEEAERAIQSEYEKMWQEEKTALSKKAEAAKGGVATGETGNTVVIEARGQRLRVMSRGKTADVDKFSLRGRPVLHLSADHVTASASPGSAAPAAEAWAEKSDGLSIENIAGELRVITSSGAFLVGQRMEIETTIPVDLTRFEQAEPAAGSQPATQGAAAPAQIKAETGDRVIEWNGPVEIRRGGQ